MKIIENSKYYLHFTKYCKNISLQKVNIQYFFKTFISTTAKLWVNVTGNIQNTKIPFIQLILAFDMFYFSLKKKKNPQKSIAML